MRPRLRPWHAFLIAAIGIGCFRDPDIDNVRCSTNDCPAGFVCVSPPNGRCIRASHIDGASATDAPSTVAVEADGSIDRDRHDAHSGDGIAFDVNDDASEQDAPLDGGSAAGKDTADLPATGGRGGEDANGAGGNGGAGGTDGSGRGRDSIEASASDAVDAPVGGAGGAWGTGGIGGRGGSSAGGMGSGGLLATGGTASTGEVVATGGTPGTGGAAATGGVVSTGGIVADGGTPGTGGTLGTGGIVATGGVTSTGGIVGTGGSSTPITPAELVPGLAAGFYWEATCAGTITVDGHNCPLTGTGSTCPSGGRNMDTSINVGGEAGKQYTINIEVRGVVGTRCYAGGARASTDTLQTEGNNNWWHVGGAPYNATGWWNTYELHVSPSTGSSSGDVYYFNSASNTPGDGGDCEREASYLVKYTASFKVMGGGSLLFRIHDNNCKAIQNCGSVTDKSAPCSARTVDLTGMSPQPPASSPAANQPVTNTSSGTTYNPQWLWITATSVAPSH